MPNARNMIGGPVSESGLRLYRTTEGGGMQMERFLVEAVELIGLTSRGAFEPHLDPTGRMSTAS
jgi:hypothetical protein